jgi:hypothetical protein
MRKVLLTATALATGFILSASAEQASQNTSGSSQAASGTQNTSDMQTTRGCGPSTMGDHASQSMAQGGFTKVEGVNQALLVHAIDPDGNPVVMIITPATQ